MMWLRISFIQLHMEVSSLVYFSLHPPTFFFPLFFFLSEIFSAFHYKYILRLAHTVLHNAFRYVHDLVMTSFHLFTHPGPIVQD